MNNLNSPSYVCMEWSPCGSDGKEFTCNAGDLGWEETLEKRKATHSSILAWRIPWTVQSMGSQRVGHNLSNFHFLFMYVGICHIMEMTTFNLLDLHPPSPPQLLLTASTKEKISLYSLPRSEHSDPKD